MRQDFGIIKKPEWISYNDIHNLLFVAHENNRKKGFHVKTADMDEASLAEHIGEAGECFVALEGEKIIGVTAVRKVYRNNKYLKGMVTDQILVAVHPDYQGQGISTALHEKVISFTRENKIDYIELRTASKNINMQKACIKWGFRYVNFVAYPNVDHYTVVMLKCLNGAQVSGVRIKLHYYLKKIYVIMRFKPRCIKRFGV